MEFRLLLAEDSETQEQTGHPRPALLLTIHVSELLSLIYSVLRNDDGGRERAEK